MSYFVVAYEVPAERAEAVERALLDIDPQAERYLGNVWVMHGDTERSLGHQVEQILHAANGERAFLTEVDEAQWRRRALAGQGANWPPLRPGEQLH